MNSTLWVKNPYPFRFEEMQAIEDALHTTYGSKTVYFKEWPVHFVEVENVTLTTAKQIANALKFAHYQARNSDRYYGRQMSSEPIEVEVRGRLDGRPSWASTEKEV